MAIAELDDQMAAATENTSPDGAAVLLLLLNGDDLETAKPNNLSVGKIRFGTPASAVATGVQGQVMFDASYIYACVATNTWKRVAIASW